MIQEEITRSRAAMENVTTMPEIQTRMAGFGYNAPKMKQGKTLIDRVNLLHILKKDKYDERQQIALTLAEDTATCRRQYMEHVKVAREAFRKEPALKRQLQIDRAIPKRLSLWLPMAQSFYTKLAEVHSQMTRYAITVEEISQARMMVASIQGQREGKLAKKGEAENTTHQRDLAQKEMRAWMKDFYSVARVALKDSPQLLEAIGIAVKSQKV